MEIKTYIFSGDLKYISQRTVIELHVGKGLKKSDLGFITYLKGKVDREGQRDFFVSSLFQCAIAYSFGGMP